MDKRLFAIGDIHGCLDEFRELVEDKIKLQKSDKLILLGDYIDRGDKSKEVVDYIMDLLEKGYDIIPLLGNHEFMLLAAYEDDDESGMWLYNGGTETLESFKASSAQNIDSKYIQFFKELRYYYSFEDFLFVHAGFDNYPINPFTEYNAMIWKSREHYNNPIFKDKTIIHGHRTITPDECEERILAGRNVINIDTGCVYKHVPGYGRLTAYNCYTQKTLFV